MIGLWENVKQIHSIDLIGAVTIRADQLRQIASQSRRVARNVVNARGGELLDMRERFHLHARARRIDDDQVRCFMPAR